MVRKVRKRALRLSSPLESSYTSSIIEVLPVELLTEITLLLEKDGESKFMRTCKHLFQVVIRHLYQTVHIRERKARMFFIRMSCTPTYFPYAKIIRSLDFTGMTATDAYLSYGLLIPALIQLSALEHLNLNIPRQHTAFAVQHLRRVGITHHPLPYDEKSTLPLIEARMSKLPLSSTEHAREAIDVWCLLPMLNHLVISMHVHLLDLFRNCPIQNLEIISAMGRNEIKYTIEVFKYTRHGNRSVTSLSLHVDVGTTEELISSLVRVSRTFPGLEYITIYAPCVNAIAISERFASDRSFFRDLQGFGINQRCTTPAHFISVKDKCIDKQRLDIKAAGLKRYSLVSFQCGPIIWLKVDDVWSMIDLVGNVPPPCDEEHHSGLGDDEDIELVDPTAVRVTAHHVHFLLPSDDIRIRLKQ